MVNKSYKIFLLPSAASGQGRDTIRMLGIMYTLKNEKLYLSMSTKSVKINLSKVVISS